MVTKIRAGARAHLYIEEWMTERGLNDEALGARMEKSRVTVWRWRTEQHRLNPEKIAALAAALDLEPEQLWRPPSQPSVDAILKDAPDETKKKALELITVFLKRAS